MHRDRAGEGTRLSHASQGLAHPPRMFLTCSLHALTSHNIPNLGIHSFPNFTLYVDVFIIFIIIIIIYFLRDSSNMSQI